MIISLDDLAAMMQRGFIRIDEKFDAIDKRFDVLESKVDSMDVKFTQRFEKVETLLYQVASDVEKISERLTRLEEFVHTAIKSNKEDIDLALKEISSLKTRLSKLEGLLIH